LFRRVQSIGRILTHAAILFGCATSAARQQTVLPRQGDIVILKSLDVELESQERRIPTDDSFRVYKVQSIDGDRLLLFGDHFYPTGWVKSSDVVAADKALDYFSGRINREANSPIDHFLRGAILLRLGQLEHAKDDLVHAIGLDPKLTPARIELAKIKSKVPDFSGARVELNEAIRLDPNSAPAHLSRAEILCFEGSFDRAITDITEAIRLQPNNGFLYCKRAYVWGGLSKDENALADYETGLRLAPKTDWAYVARGIILESKGKTELAIADFDKAIQLNARRDEAFIHRAYAKLRLGNGAAALKDATEAVRIAPTSSLAHTALGIALEETGKFDQAGDNFNTAVALDPKSGDSFWWRGYHWERQSKFELALADYTEALRLQPKNPSFYYTRSRVSWEKGDLALAKSDLDEAIRQLPEFGDAYLLRSFMWAPTHEYDRALADLEMAIRHDGKLEFVVAAHRSWILATCPEARFRDGRKAIENAQVLLRHLKASNSPDQRSERAAEIIMAVAQAEAGDFDPAITSLRRALEIEIPIKSNDAVGFQDDRRWMETVLKSLQSKRAYREALSDTEERKVRLRQPRSPAPIERLRAVSLR
jgi:tetratricopeptide (TPR) repeat protein